MMSFEGVWKGRFESDMYRLLFGFITPVKGTVEVDTANRKALLKYTGFYRSGDKTDMTIELEALTGEQEGRAFGFKGQSLITSQQVKFEITSGHDDKLIEGTYVSEHPLDKGRFWLEKDSSCLGACV